MNRSRLSFIGGVTGIIIRFSNQNEFAAEALTVALCLSVDWLLDVHSAIRLGPAGSPFN
ncbi:MAG: hypothetical protein MI923_04675 [Phycisphaerales bacterium]|nr:hypothetical protein [Phycisphaerales bacterium]